MRFSIVTPTLNRLEKLKQCVGSVRGQTEIDRQHLVQDACSVDGSQEWMRLQSDLLFVSEKDNGMYDAIMRGWQRSDGDVLCWINSDEQYLPGTLALVRDTFRKNPDIDFVFGNYIVVNQDGSPIAARREIGLRASYVANGNLYAASCTMFFRRSLLEKGLLNFDGAFKYAADMELVLRLLDRGCRWKRIDSYLSLFTFDGTNLSCSPRMLDETEVIRRRYGASRHRFGRTGVLIGRKLERLFAGCYARQTVEYSYATDERPSYVVRGSKLLGGLYLQSPNSK